MPGLVIRITTNHDANDNFVMNNTKNWHLALEERIGSKSARNGRWNTCYRKTLFDDSFQARNDVNHASKPGVIKPSRKQDDTNRIAQRSSSLWISTFSSSWRISRSSSLCTAWKWMFQSQKHFCHRWWLTSPDPASSSHRFWRRQTLQQRFFSLRKKGKILVAFQLAVIVSVVVHNRIEPHTLLSQNFTSRTSLVNWPTKKERPSRIQTRFRCFWTVEWEKLPPSPLSLSQEALPTRLQCWDVLELS